MNETKVAKAIIDDVYHKALGEVFKAKDGDKKMIFGKPFEMKGGKWVPSSGGGKKEGAPKASTSTPEDEKKKKQEEWDLLDRTVDSMPKDKLAHMKALAERTAKQKPGLLGREREKLRADTFKKLILEYAKNKK